MITSMSIVRLLKQKHSLDLCFPECKTGPTIIQDSHPIRIDFIAIKRSWTQSNIYGYEIKVNRSDFLNDNKWPEYLKYCTCFYFVCPPGIIDKSELPQDVGLYETSVNGGRLFCRKKAPIRQVNIPESFYWYLLINRVTADKSWSSKEGSKIEYWKNWLSEKDEKKQLGYNVSKKIRVLVDTKIKDVEKENTHLKEKIHDYDSLIRYLQSIGISEKDIKNGSYWTLKRKIDEIKDTISHDLLHNIDRSVEFLQQLKEKIVRIKNENI